MMTNRKCRTCAGELFSTPLMVYKDMPATSQFLPSEEDLADEECIDLKICQCSKCGLVQLDNDPIYYFKDVIRAGSVSEGVKNVRTKQFQDFVDDFHLKGKKIIEIGCGRGEYLEFMNNTGANAYGLEHRKESVEDCRAKGLKVIQGFLNDPSEKIEHGPFDAFFICNFLEHFDEPSLALRAIANNLTDDGIGFVEVPNTDNIIDKTSFYKFTLEHLLNFTKETLTSTLRNNGFDVLSCEIIQTGSGAPIYALVRKKKPLNFDKFKNNQKVLYEEIDSFLKQFDKEKTVIWGAGHHTFGLLSVLNFQDKIKYIVDSASYKQEKYSPKTHLPIVSPEAFYSDTVKGIIVCAGGYSDEVIKLIQKNYPFNIKIAAISGTNLVEVS
jgi:2-polyprenyl-3-methyl-5-hydroxy-6-metoxy-1,4-benzoquinol methylase